jgi:hypothetical protein
MASAPSERIFSHCGITLTNNQTPTEGSALMNQMLLKFNMENVYFGIEDMMLTSIME